MDYLANRLSLSTCWCSGRHTDGYEMICEIVGLGFKRIELSHGIRVSLVPGILKAVDEGLVEISSVHNFCPLPGVVNHSAPNLYEPSASDKRELSSWSRYTQQTFDFAKKTGAKKVVMHSGSVRFFFQSPEKKLKKWLHSQQNIEVSDLLENKTFIIRRDRTLRRIRKASDKPMQRVQSSYEQAVEWAKECDLKLCIENREGLVELPLDNDFVDFMNMFPDSESIGYWHDTGHAQIKHQYGLINHRDHLSSLSEQLAGFHLHDVSENGVDHQPVGSGSIDFKMIAEFVRPEHELVLELSPHVSAEDLLASRDYIGELLD